MIVTKYDLISIALLYNYMENKKTNLSIEHTLMLCNYIKNNLGQEKNIKYINQDLSIKEMIDENIFIPYSLIYNYRDKHPYEYSFPTQKELLGIRLDSNGYCMDDLDAIMINYKIMAKREDNIFIKKIRNR